MHKLGMASELNRSANTIINKCRYVPILPSNNFNYIMIGLQAVTMVIAVPGNLITILTIIKSRKLRENVTYIFVLSVSIADFLVGLIAQPLFIGNIYTLTSNIRLCKAGVLTGFICGCASISGIIGITLDRFIYIVFPYKYQRILTRRRAIIFITVLWSFGIILGAVHLFWYDPTVVQVSMFILITISSLVSLKANMKFLSLSRKAQRNTSKPSTLFTTQRTTSTVSTLYTLSTTQTTTSTTSTLPGLSVKKIKKQLQVTHLILKICLAFGVCWLPYGIFGLVHATTETTSKYVVIAFYWGIAIGYSNSALNIIIYARGNTVLTCEIKRFLDLRKK